MLNTGVFGQTAIAEVIDGKPVIIADKEVLLNNWNNNLEKLSSIKGEFTELDAVIINDKYYLVATGKLYKSAILLEEIDKTNKLMGTGITCTTKDCATLNGACVPKPNKTACTDCGYNGDCTKTTTGVSLVHTLE